MSINSQVQTAARPRPGLIQLITAVGPGIVFMLTTVGAGSIVSNTASGATYGYALIWAVGMAIFFQYVWLYLAAKYVLVTGETLFKGYGRLGGWIVWFVLAVTVIGRHLFNMYQIRIMGSSFDLLLPLPTRWSAAIWSLLFVFLGFSLAFWGGYNALERSFKAILMVFGGALILAVSYARPDPAAVLRGMFIPSLPGESGFYSALLLLMALVGTEGLNLSTLTYPYFIYEKGWRSISYLREQKLDLLLGAIGIFVVDALLQIAAAAVIHPTGTAVTGAEHMVQVFSRSLGTVGLVAFALGLWAASFTTFVGVSSGNAMFVADICRSFIPAFKKPEGKRRPIHSDPIYRWFLIYAAFSPLYVLFTGVSPVWLTLVVNALIVVVAPILTIPLLILTNSSRLMGEYKNSWTTNAVLGIFVLVILYLTYKQATSILIRLMGAL